MLSSRLPRWLAVLDERSRAPQKAPPPDGALSVQRWGIPPELRYRRAWAAWRYEQDSSGRWSKPPYNPMTGAKAEPSDSSTWSEFDEAYGAYQNGQSPDGKRPYDGVSFALDPRWGIVGVDLDHVSGHRLQAARIARELGSYSEHTPSGDGLRIFVKGALPEGRRRRDWVEIYNQRRFLTVTGRRLESMPEEIRSSPRLLSVWQQWVQQNG